MTRIYNNLRLDNNCSDFRDTKPVTTTSTKTPNAFIAYQQKVNKNEMSLTTEYRATVSFLFVRIRRSLKVNVQLNQIIPEQQLRRILQLQNAFEHVQNSVLLLADSRSLIRWNRVFPEIFHRHLLISLVSQKNKKQKEQKNIKHSKIINGQSLNRWQQFNCLLTH